MEKLQAKYQVLSETEQVASTDKTYRCDKCKDVGGFFETKVDEEEGFTYGNKYQVWSDCECEKQRIVSNLLKASEITEAFKAMTFGNFVTDDCDEIVAKSKDLALSYYKQFNDIKNDDSNSIALLGQPGVGKTHLLTALSNNIMANKLVSVLYFPYVEGFNDLRNDFEKLEAKLIRMKEVDILFIDDLFKPINKRIKDAMVKVPQATEWEIKQLYAVINYRYMNHKPMFISSELIFDEMINLDEALGTRIYQMCKKNFVQIEKDLGLNYRLK